MSGSPPPANPGTGPAAGDPRLILRLALALALTSAVSLGLARFSYALILPPMRADLGWSYFLSGAMNTANAAGYLAGALMCRGWLARFEARRVLAVGSSAAVLALLAHGLWVPDGSAAPIDAALHDTAAARSAIPHSAWLALVRFAGGVASAAMFVAGGVLAARLASRAGDAGGRPRSGLVLGIYYGGTGLGIVLSALTVPWISQWATGHAWRWAWIGLGLLAALAQWATSRLLSIGAGTDFLAAAAAPDGKVADGAPPRIRFPWRLFGPSLAGYFCFGLGYIGYMTFVVTLLREQRLPAGLVTLFFSLLGVGVMASSGLWAGLLQRHRGGRPMAQLNALLAVAAALPVLSGHPLAVLVSGALFGSVFLSVVASTTALVRHNLPEAAWTPGIAAYTVVFAIGQIMGPGLVGWVADGTGGLLRGFTVGAATLALGAALAARQRPLREAAG